MSGVALIVQLLLASLEQAGHISSIIGKLAEEGRTELTPEEWATIVGDNAAARARLVAAIAAAEAKAKADAPPIP